MKVVLFGILGSLVGGLVGVVAYALVFMNDGDGSMELLLAFGVMLGGIPGAVIGGIVGLVFGSFKAKQ